MPSARRTHPEHRIKRDQLVKVDRLQSQLFGGLLDQGRRQAAEPFLEEVEDHQRRAPRLGIAPRNLRDRRVHLIGWFFPHPFHTAF